MKVTVCRKEHFNAAHRLAHPQWTEEENQRVFGKCANKNYHGHNYDLTVKLTGHISPETGYVYDMKKLSLLIQEYVVEHLDHKNLNLDIPHFQHIIPTAENIAAYIYKLLKPHLKTYDLNITLQETERNYVQYPG